MKIGIQQFMLSKALRSEEEAKNTLSSLRAMGYEGIELCSFMTEKTPMMVRVLTKLAGMPVGKGGTFNWESLVKETGLSVPSFHVYLGTLEKEEDYKKALINAKKFGTKNITITGMYRFDYTNEEEVHSLAKRLNICGKHLKEDGYFLLYHNHNSELMRAGEKRAYDILKEETDPEYLNFEFDSYWWTEGGGNAIKEMEDLGERLFLWHINDRGHRSNGKMGITPIVSTDSMELGYGNMDLDEMYKIALKNKTEYVILETHKNWINNNPIESAELSIKYLNNKKIEG